MKRKELMKYLTKCDCHVVDEGGGHTAVMNFKNSKKSYIPRHAEIKHGTLRAICKQLDIASPL